MVTQGGRESHWMANERTRSAFWSTCTNLGLDEHDVHDILGAAQSADQSPLESVYDWNATLADAIQTLHANKDGPPAGPEAASGGGAALDVTPERLALQERLFDAVSTGKALSPVSGTCIVRTTDGGHWMVTLRAGMPEPMMIEAMRSLVRCIEIFETSVLKGRKWLPVTRSSEIVAFGHEGTVSGEYQGRGSAPRSGGRQRSAPASGVPGYERVKVGRLDELTCKRSGAFEFHVTGLQHPLKDSRGVDTVSSLLFADECWSDTFTTATLAEGRNLDSVDYGALSVRYGKSTESGYWDVLSVFPTP